MAELSRGEMRRIARAFVRRSMRIGLRRGAFDAVRMLYNRTDPTCERFAFTVEEECWRTGAHTLLLSFASGRERLRYLLKPESSLRKMSPFAEAIAKRADVSIFIGEDDDPNWAKGVEGRIRLTAPIREKLHDILDRRKVRWAYFGWPVPGAARTYGCGTRRFRDIFFDSIRRTFYGEVARLCRIYRSLLEGGRTVRIMAEDGTDLSFRITGRPILVDDGVISDEDLKRGDVGVNIPAGEVFVAPIETSADGSISFEEIAIPGFGKVRGLELTFRDGRIRRYSAEDGERNFDNFLRANTGEKDRIAEFGIGTNPGAKYTGGSIIIDEKIFGTVHVAIGNNRGAYHGRNKASSHLDMIKDMGNGEVLVDDRIVMRGGRPVKR
ncbi:MAG: aminopeptidase [Candidatus Hadarchaeales archaeon]